ncbi:hypothetical protein B0H14DRAFT_3453666 [Mycena olivaceomarginata]|nr:hypothetical protein B0H14DRAFT_3453666 [Mycena olivaceomarginata]
MSHFETIAALLDTTRAVPTSTRHNPFKFDDRSMSNAPYDVLAHAHRFEPTTFLNWLDPRSLPAYKRTYLARSWMLKGPRGKGSQRRSYPRCARLHIAASLQGCAAASVALLTDDLRRSALTAQLPCLHDLGTVLSTTCVHSVRRGHSPPSALRPSHPTTAPILSAVPPPDTRASVFSTKTTAAPARGAACAVCANGVDPQCDDAPAKSARAHGDNAAMLCAGMKIPLCSLSERAAAPAAFQERRPTASARGREGGRVTYCGIAGEVLVPAHLTFLLPFFVYHSFMYFM